MRGEVRNAQGNSHTVAAVRLSTAILHILIRPPSARNLEAERRKRAEGVLDHSLLVRVAHAMERCALGATESSIAVRGHRSLVRATKASSWYRWLTAEPEPREIRIDLRETRTVGPVIRFVERREERIRSLFQRIRKLRPIQIFATRPLSILGAMMLIGAVLSLGVILVSRPPRFGELLVHGGLIVWGIVWLRSELSLSEPDKT